ncbi:hypothetical protein GCM10010171_63440 [Actinokineospora fastidiosa]|uniref:Uncharacterized protein n=2 Tax=Actinokineospora fastidiosa TaxID=1816 RepID=A0A918GUI4_9PSEU|nr:hypothetical protein GCM10010171_63440 [Actinokineospora fastidiosa]
MTASTRTRANDKTRATGGLTQTTEMSRTLSPDPDPVATPRTDSEDKLWAALHAHPNSTAAVLSQVAGIGKTTAQKILLRWAGEGGVTRTIGRVEAGRRAADLWTITDKTAPPADVVEPDIATNVASENDHAAADTPAPAPHNPTLTDPESADSAENNSTPTAADVQGAAARESSTLTDEDTVTETAEPPVRSAESVDTADGEGGKAERLAPGALRGMVEDYLRDHPGQECSPVEIARKLGGKSTGAVSNALDKLVGDGVAVRTQDRPRRFTLAPPEATTGSH